VFLLAVVAIVFQLVSADPLSLLPITSLGGLVATLGGLLTALLATVLGLVCTVVGALVGSILVFIQNIFNYSYLNSYIIESKYVYSISCIRHSYSFQRLSFRQNPSLFIS